MPRTIIVVDDEAMNRETLESMLRKDYNIYSFPGGTQALSFLRKNSALVSAILLDLKMPGMDGFEVMAEIKKNLAMKYIPIIVITSLSDPDAEEKAVSLGAYGFISKPFKSVLLKHHLNNAISFKESAMLQNLIYRDELTKILNSKGFANQAEAMIRTHPAGYYMLSAFNVDSFKVINDQYGSKMGDRVLQHIALVTSELVTPLGGICCRVSADSFMSMYPAVYLGTEIVQQAHKKLISPTFINRTLNIRFGRFLVDDESIPISTMYDRAVLAMESVRGRYDAWEAVYSDSMREKLLLEQRIVSEMESALENNQFEIWLQPQYNLSSGALIGSEALVRWRHPERGIITPGEFIPVFERSGFIYSLDKYVWEQVCIMLSDWLAQGRNPLPISVNISREDLTRDDVVSVLVGLIEKYGIDISLLRLEITETAFCDSAELITEVVKKLIANGFTVEIDDFGSGYSSLNTLKDIPAQIIKLDSKLLENTEDSQRGGNIVESIVRMAKWLNMSVIAEGVETPQQADYLRSIGCNYVQGYLYAKPMTAKCFEKLCNGKRKEDYLLNLETVEHLDNNSFWDPSSIDTLIFNSYVGACCIFEHHNANIELLRTSEKYIQVIESAGMKAEDAMRINWANHLDEDNITLLTAAIEKSSETKKEVTDVYRFLSLPGCPDEIYLRSSLRVIAKAGNRYLIYCSIENITAQLKAELEQKDTYRQLQRMLDDMPGGFARIGINTNARLNLIYVNDSFLELINSTREKVMSDFGENVLAAIHPDDVNTVRNTLAALDSTNDTVNSVIRLRHGNSGYTGLSVTARYSKNSDGKAYLNAYFSTAGEPGNEEKAQNHLMNSLQCGINTYELHEGQIRLVYSRRQQFFSNIDQKSYSLFQCNLRNDSLSEMKQGELLSFNFNGAERSLSENITEYVRSCVYKDDAEGFMTFFDSETLMASYSQSKLIVALEYRELLPDSGHRWLRLTVDMADSLQTEDAGAYLMFENIDGIKRAEIAAKALSETDPLTGVLNRTTFSAKINERLARSKPDERHVLLMLDIDDFKRINDMFGHATGDQALIDISENLRSMAGRNDLVGRLGGDEFLIFLDNVPDDETVRNKAALICSLVRRSFGSQLNISGSVGIASAPGDGMDFDTLYIKADSALYGVKRSGKDSYAYER